MNIKDDPEVRALDDSKLEAVKGGIAMLPPVGPPRKTVEPLPGASPGETVVVWSKGT